MKPLYEYLNESYKWTKDEKNLVTRISVFAYKNAHTLDARLSNLYHNALAL